jgi:hypothetical protein
MEYNRKNKNKPICWKYVDDECDHCDNQHYKLNIHSLIVVIKSHYDYHDTIHVNSIQGATLDSLDGVSMCTFPSKIHDEKCLCHNTIMTILTKKGYEIKFVNTILEKYIIVHLQKLD